MPALKSGDIEFYVGYHPQAPAALARRTRLVAWSLCGLAVLVAGALVLGQGAFDASRFEFQQYGEYRGIFSAWPYPILSTSAGDYLLVGEGKHGVKTPSGADGRVVQLRGAKAENGGTRLLELLPGSFAFSTSLVMQPPPRVVTPGGTMTLSGEIVDTKCYLGVMNPGRGKVHRDCAARCLSGGLPPGLLVRDSARKARLLLLSGVDRAQLLPMVAEPVSVTGRVVRAGTWWVMETTASAVRRE